MSLTQEQKDTIREEFYNSYRLAVKNGGIHNPDTLDEFSDYWLNKCCIFEKEAYNKGYEDGKNNILGVSPKTL